MVSRISELDALAKMNLSDKRCYQVYKAIIEPNIKSMIESYFKDWQNIEMQVTALMMKHKGIFTTRQAVISVDDNDQDFSLVRDVEEFKKVKRQNFGLKLRYLIDNGLISQPLSDLLGRLAKRRNKIHDYNGILTEDDRTLFAAGASLLHPTYIAGVFESEKEAMKYSIQMNDEAAKKLLQSIDNWDMTGTSGSMFIDHINIDKVKGGWELDRQQNSKSRS